MAETRDSKIWLRRLVGHDTTSRLSNLGLIEEVRDYLADHRIDSHLSFDDAGAKANLFATIGPADADGGLVLSGHTDVVPVDGQDWTHDPFALTERDGRLHGRGAADMKGFIACCLAAVPRLAAAELAAPIHLALSYDEEVGCIGVRRLLDALPAHLKATPAGCVVGEPTGLQPRIGQKGMQVVTVEVTGTPGHSSRAPDFVNAVEYAARLLGAIAGVKARIAQAPRDDGFDPPFSTLSIGPIAGGTVQNVVPQHCRFSFDLRHLPGADADALLAEIEAEAARLAAEMQAIAPGAGFAFSRRVMPAGAIAEDSPLVRQVKAACGHDGPCGKVSYVTEAALFQQAGIAAIICGPGDIAQAHIADEYVSIAQMERCDEFLARLTGGLGRR